MINLTSGGDAIEADTDVVIVDGEFTLNWPGVFPAWSMEPNQPRVSRVGQLNIDGGTLNINSSDDAIHSNGSITINGGTFTIATGDDGIHADPASTSTGVISDYQIL